MAPETSSVDGPASQAAKNAEGSAKKIESRTAILIIHGIGQQLPFSTLDQFAQGFVRYLTPEPAANDKSGTTWPYQLIQLATLANNDRGCDFCLRLKHPASQGYLDLHEYYWAYETEKKSSLSEISDWLTDALASFNKHYQENRALQLRYEQDNPRRKVSKLGWLRYGVWAWRFAQLADGLVSLLPTGIMRSIRSTASAVFPAKLITDFMGDVVVYTTSDRKSGFTNVRDKIMCGALAKVRALLQNSAYDQVIVAGHSLGSVIGYDVLNRMDLICNFPDNMSLKEHLPKLKAFITFGSPLDKVYFFLREKAEQEEYIKRQLLDNLRLFRKHPVDRHSIPIETGPVFTSALDDKRLPWHNFYHDNDDISGHLDFYQGVDNIQVKKFFSAKDNKWYRAHLAYWTHKELYQKFLEYILPPDAPTSAGKNERVPEMAVQP